MPGRDLSESGRTAPQAASPEAEAAPAGRFADGSERAGRRGAAAPARRDRHRPGSLARRIPRGCRRPDARAILRRRSGRVAKWASRDQLVEPTRVHTRKASFTAQKNNLRLSLRRFERISQRYDQFFVDFIDKMLIWRPPECGGGSDAEHAPSK